MNINLVRPSCKLTKADPEASTGSCDRLFRLPLVDDNRSKGACPDENADRSSVADRDRFGTILDESSDV